MGKIRRRSALFLFVFTIFNTAGKAGAADTVYYRYVNKQGIKVINYTIPPEYSQKGYEIVSTSGQVIKVVKPAVPKSQAAEEEARRREQEVLDKWDNGLRRRYSSVADIEAAKKRKLLELKANLSILGATIASLKEEIALEQSKAAGIERSNQAVPELLLSKIKDLQLELEDRHAIEQQRKKEQGKLAEKFDRDIERFKKIKAEKEPRG